MFIETRIWTFTGETILFQFRWGGDLYLLDPPLYTKAGESLWVTHDLEFWIRMVHVKNEQYGYSMSLFFFPREPIPSLLVGPDKDTVDNTKLRCWKCSAAIKSIGESYLVTDPWESAAVDISRVTCHACYENRIRWLNAQYGLTPIPEYKQVCPNDTLTLHGGICPADCLDPRRGR